MLNIYESAKECFITKTVDIDDVVIILLFLIIFLVAVTISVIAFVVYAVRSLQW